MPAPLKRKHFYVLEKHYTDLAVRCLPTLAKTGLTPNQVTIANLINGLVIMAAIAAHQYLLAAILTQLYLFLDILDGNLARYREMSTRLGAILDKIGDRFFYNGVMVVLGLSTPVHWAWIVLFLLAHNLHSIAATFYIVPAIRTMPSFRRFGLKKTWMAHGYILGMDLSTQDLLLSVLIVTPGRVWILPAATILYLVDLIYRLIELELNRRLEPAA